MGDEVADLAFRLKHDRTKQHDDFYRGQLVSLEMMLGSRADLKDWKENH